MSTQNSFESGCLAAPDTIVVATDLADLSELLPHAVAQAKASNAALHIVHAINASKVFVPESGTVPTVDPIRMAQDARKYLEERLRPIHEQGLRCTIEIGHGDPSDIVAEVTKKTGAQRVIVSSHGRTGIKRMVLGSVALRILTTSTVPVCTIGPHCYAPSGAGIKTLLHPTSLGPDAEPSAKLAFDLAQHYRAELTLLHVIAPDSAMEPCLDPQYAFANLEFLSLPSSSNSHVTVHKRVVAGDTKQEILREAQAIHADLIVLGSHATSGQTAYSVVISATCPVLSFRTTLQPELSSQQKDQYPVLAMF
jgi:nucleotide-binding universal stress UspA family protein